MRTDLLITDLTYMRDGRVCMAGVDRSLKCIRPVLPNHVYKEFLYLDSGAVIHPRTVLNIALKQEFHCQLPHVEDYRWFMDGSTTVIREAGPKNWLHVLQSTASETVAAIFEARLEHDNRNIRAGDGKRSLGTLQPIQIKELWYKVHEQRNYQFRLTFTDSSDQEFDLPINDLTLLTYVDRLQHNGLDLDYVMALLLDRCQRSETWLRLGLTREFNGWCWLQVNGIYTLPDYLVGQCFADLDL